MRWNGNCQSLQPEDEFLPHDDVFGRGWIILAQVALDRPGIATKPVSQSAIAERYEVLDSWRGISALLVALMHFPVASPLAQNPVIRSGFLFVDFFFVLSGFVIAAGYSHRLSTRADIRRFVLVRFGRLYPLHLFMLCGFVAFELLRFSVPQLGGGDGGAFTGPTNLAALVPNLLLVQGTGLMDQLTWNGVSWSISTEFFAYLLFAALIGFLGARSWIALAAAVVVGPAMLLAFSPRYMDATYDFGLIRCLYGFALGALLYRFTGASIRDGKQRLAAAGPAAFAAWSAAEVVTIAAILAFVAWAGLRPAGIAAPFVFVAAIYVFSNEGGAVSAALRSRAFLWLGAISYSVYMIHIFIQARMINVAGVLDRFAGAGLIGEVHLGKDVTIGFAAHSAAEGLAITAVMVALVLAAATITHRLVEMPALGWFRRRAKSTG